VVIRNDKQRNTRLETMNKRIKYEVSWDGKLSRYRNEYDTLEDARLAMDIHKDKNPAMHVTLNTNI